MSGKLAGKVAIVTGSTAGIGLAIARQLGKDGAKLVISSRKEQHVARALESLRKDGLDSLGVVCHVSNGDQRASLIEKTLSKYGSINFLINNVANSPVYGPMMDVIDEKIFDKMIDSNLKANFFLTKRCLQHMTSGDCVVNVSSVAAYNVLEPGLGLYGTLKTALVGLTKNLAVELAPRGIRVNGIAPGFIKTNFSKALWENSDKLKSLLRNIPANRLGEPEECAALVSFLCSQDASYITGETIAVTGGMTTRL